MEGGAKAAMRAGAGANKFSPGSTELRGVQAQACAKQAAATFVTATARSLLRRQVGKLRRMAASSSDARLPYLHQSPLLPSWPAVGPTCIDEGTCRSTRAGQQQTGVL